MVVVFVELGLSVLGSLFVHEFFGVISLFELVILLLDPVRLVVIGVFEEFLLLLVKLLDPVLALVARVPDRVFALVKFLEFGENAALAGVALENFHELDAGTGLNFRAVSQLVEALGLWSHHFTLHVLRLVSSIRLLPPHHLLDVAELVFGNSLDVNPFNLECAQPLVLILPVLEALS